jgi:signal transduction histidine kinase
LVVQVASGAVAVGLAPGGGWTPLLLVVTAVCAAYALSTKATAAVVAANSVWLGAAWLLHGIDVTNAVLGVFVYGSLQVFAVLMVVSSQQEAAARRQLAEAHVRLQAVSALLAESSATEERLRIARDLHDLVGHQLTALALELEVASHRVTSPASEHVTRARRIAKDLLRDVRSAVGEMRAQPPPLRLTVEEMARDLPRPEVHVRVADDIAVDRDVWTALVRCAQEAITNAVRHSDAENLWIDVHRTSEGAVRLQARDDGRGAPALRLGNGLTGMTERLEGLGGTVRFDHDRGFRVTAEVPAS